MIIKRLIACIFLWFTYSQSAFALPDLVITYLDYNKTLGTYTARVKNQGASATATGPTVDVGYTVDGVYKTWGIVPGPLAAGAQVLISMNGAPFVIATGAHTIDAFVDDDNKFAESDETNNHYIGGLTIANSVPASFAAFPGAQGGGAVSVGGRGGSIIEVTNLLDSGTGSLRACVSAAVPRICVFRVAGEIALLSELVVSNPYLTVAGQTAPGDGIEITGKGKNSGQLVAILTHDVIWQYTKLRHGSNSFCTAGCGSGLSAFSNNIIADHNSVQWSLGPGMSTWSWDTSVNNVTYSNNIISEGLKRDYLSDSDALTIGGQDATASGSLTNIDVHHNLIMNNGKSAPMFKNKSSRLVNNIIYNQQFHSAQFANGVSGDVVKNIFKAGPLYVRNHEINVHNGTYETHASGLPSIYMTGNVGWNQASPSGDQWLLANQNSCDLGDDSGAVDVSWQRTTPLTDPTFAISAESTSTLESSLTPIVGASQRLDCSGHWQSSRDAVDSRMITQYSGNTGNSFTITSETDVGGYPTLSSGTSCVDSDVDGLPDQYELLHGLNPAVNDSQTSFTIADPGYSYLDMFLQGLDPCVFNCGSSAPVLSTVTCTPSTVQSIGITTCTASVTSGTPTAWSWTNNACTSAQCISTATTNPGVFTCNFGGLCTLCAQASSAGGQSNVACTSSPVTVKYRKPQSLQGR